MRFETNIKEFNIELSKVVASVQKFESSLDECAAQYWPRIRDKLKIALSRNIEYIHSGIVPTTDYWKNVKTKYMGKILRNNPPWRTERFYGQFYPIISDKDWLMTGAMDSAILDRLYEDNGEIRKTADGVELSLNVYVGDFFEEKQSGLPYPLAVDDKLQENSFGDVGLFMPQDKELSPVLDALVTENTNLFQTIFGK